MKAMGYAKTVIESISGNESSGTLSWAIRSGDSTTNSSLNIKNIKVNDADKVDGIHGTDLAKKSEPLFSASAGGVNNPVYFSDGMPKACNYFLKTNLVAAVLQSSSDTYSGQIMSSGNYLVLKNGNLTHYPHSNTTISGPAVVFTVGKNDY